MFNNNMLFLFVYQHISAIIISQNLAISSSRSVVYLLYDNHGFSIINYDVNASQADCLTAEVTRKIWPSIINNLFVISTPNDTETNVHGDYNTIFCFFSTI